MDSQSDRESGFDLCFALGDVVKTCTIVIHSEIYLTVVEMFSLQLWLTNSHMKILQFKLFIKKNYSSWRSISVTKSKTQKLNTWYTMPRTNWLLFYGCPINETLKKIKLKIEQRIEFTHTWTQKLRASINMYRYHKPSWTKLDIANITANVSAPPVYWYKTATPVPEPMMIQI